MVDLTPSRKSGRKRVPSRKYRDDAFETLKSVLSSDEDEQILQQGLLQDDSDEFPTTQAVEDHEDEDGSLAGDVSDGSAIVTPVEEYEDAHSYASSDPGSPGIVRSDKSKAKEHDAYVDADLRYRGMAENPLKRDDVRSVVKLFSGEGVEDISHIVESRERWAADPTLPRRSNLHRGFSHTEENRQMEATVGWDWYYDQGGRESFTAKQNVQPMTTAEALPYSGLTGGDQEFVLGPYGRQIKYSLAPAHSLELDQAWTKPESLAPELERERHGWILNIGTCVKCMDWAPNHEENIQYLALATANVALPPCRESPAFTPFPGQSAIQIWAFAASADQGEGKRPFLHSILCTDWGEIKQLKWCPVPRTARSPANSDGQLPLNVHVGLLAIICGDGFARVLDVRLNSNDSIGDIAHAQKYNGSSFAASAPAGNVSTCLTWLSSTDLAIGYSNGNVAIYDIWPHTDPELEDTNGENSSQKINAASWGNPIAWLSMPLHSTYILALNSAYPTHPSLLLSSSLSGHLRLTSLLAPKIDYVLSARTRSPPSSLAYCDALMSAVGAEESSDTMRIWGLRCFYAHFACAKLPAPPGPGHGIVDVGKCHPTIASGCADGSVIVTNPLRKILGKKQAGHQQCIFRHEWRPRDTTKTGEEGLKHRHGLSRFTEGHAVEKVNLGMRKRWKENVPTTTIYEEETAVTALSWNPNLSCGGWLAVGWCSGLVRVQDVAID